jgi:hypothetical protein
MRRRQARSRSTNVATQITATTQPTRPALRFRVLEAAIVTVIAVAAVALAIWTQTSSSATTGPMSAVDVAGHYGPGYPLHGGLAGPSRVGQTSTVAGPLSAVDAGRYSAAGSSGPMSAVDLAGHYGPGYPLRGGLAGPSRVGVVITDAGSLAPDYPLHGGLAGPSRASNDGD